MTPGIKTITLAATLAAGALLSFTAAQALELRSARAFLKVCLVPFGGVDGNVKQVTVTSVAHGKDGTYGGYGSKCMIKIGHPVSLTVTGGTACGDIGEIQASNAVVDGVECSTTPSHLYIDVAATGASNGPRSRRVDMAMGVGSKDGSLTVFGGGNSYAALQHKTQTFDQVVQEMPHALIDKLCAGLDERCNNIYVDWPRDEQKEIYLMILSPKPQ